MLNPLSLHIGAGDIFSFRYVHVFTHLKAIGAGADLTGGWAAFDVAEKYKIGGKKRELVPCSLAGPLSSLLSSFV